MSVENSESLSVCVGGGHFLWEETLVQTGFQRMANSVNPLYDNSSIKAR